jgi:hypothetical protein
VAYSGGGGGGGAWVNPTNYANRGGTGGSGIIYLSYPDSVTASFSAGVTVNTYGSSGTTFARIIAAGASDTVTFG